MLVKMRTKYKADFNCVITINIYVN